MIWEELERGLWLFYCKWENEVDIYLSNIWFTIEISLILLIIFVSKQLVHWETENNGQRKIMNDIQLDQAKQVSKIRVSVLYAND